MYTLEYPRKARGSYAAHVSPFVVALPVGKWSCGAEVRRASRPYTHGSIEKHLKYRSVVVSCLRYIRVYGYICKAL